MKKTKTHESPIYNINRKLQVSRRAFIIINYSIITLIIIIGILPLINIFCMSLSSNEFVTAGEVYLWPRDFTLKAYSFVVKNQAFYSSLIVTAKMVVLGEGLILLNTVLVAYPLSKNNKYLKGRNILVWVFIIPMLFSGGLIPWFMVIKYTGLINNILGLILPSSVNTFYILLLMNFIKGLPGEIEESAYIDGAGHLRLLASIILPLTKPATAAIFLFSFVALWNSWFEGIIIMTRPENYPLQTYLYTILQFPDIRFLKPEEIHVFMEINTRSVNSAQIFITALPIFITYPYISKYFAKGIMLGSVKG